MLTIQALSAFILVVCFNVAIYKRHHWTAFIGVLLFPVLVVSAVRLAQPNSWWARRFYDTERLKRAEARHGALNPDEKPKGWGFPACERPRWPERGRRGVPA